MRNESNPYRMGDLAAAVQKALGISPSGADLLTPLARCVELRRSTKTKDFEIALGRLVDALNQGARPDVLTGVLVPQVHINGPVGEPLLDEKEWQGGAFADRCDLQRRLWDDAAKFKGTSPDKASAYARAAILLAAHDDFAWMGWSGANRCVRWRGEFKGLTGLDEEHSLQLSDAVQRHRRRYDALRDEKLTELCKAIDRLSEDARPRLSLEKLDGVLEKLESCWPPACFDLGQSWEIANLAWYVLNIARQRRSRKEIAKVEGLIKGWLAEAKEPHVKRWLTEALEREGREPGRLYLEAKSQS